jgi:hypothetical protein
MTGWANAGGGGPSPISEEIVSPLSGANAATKARPTTFGASELSAVMIWPPYEWPTTMVGPVCLFKTCRSRARSLAKLLSIWIWWSLQWQRQSVPVPTPTATGVR